MNLKQFFSIFLPRLFKKQNTEDKKDAGSWNSQKQDFHPSPPDSPMVSGTNIKQSPSQSLPEKKARKRQTVQRAKKDRWSLENFDVPPKEGFTRFHDLKLSLNIMHAIADLEFKYCMPVQAEVLPCTLSGRDATAKAQTGTGKSAAFLITIISRLLRYPIRGKRPKGSPRALILAPTRELVMQIEKDAKALSRYTPLKILSVFGGMAYKKQQDFLENRPVDIIAATPGRLIDFMEKKVAKLNKVEILIIDEADRMLDMGFMPDIRRIVYATPHKDKRQTLFFSATLSQEILRLSSQWTKDAKQIEIDPDHAASENINQKVFIITEDQKITLLYNLITGGNLERVIIFVNRRDTTRRLERKLKKYGMEGGILSGEVSQTQRIKTLDNFKNGKVKILIATDVAARGLHIEGVSHVINYDLPDDPEHYIHRIGRTGRAGAEGISVSFADEMSSFYIPAIEDVLGEKLICEYPDNDMLKPLPRPLKIQDTQKNKSRKRYSPIKKYRPKNRSRRSPSGAARQR